ncbi:MAG: NUDIX domain-containing protein [Candidatus Nanopelagicales bacterium]
MIRPLVADAIRVLTQWNPPTPAAAALRRRVLGFLAEHPDADQRDQRAGHLTASTLILDDARERVLLTLHPMAGRWFQLGGHLEARDTSVADAAAREAAEESGIGGLIGHRGPIGLDWHAVTCRDSAGSPGPSSHVDLEYLAVAPPDAQPRITDESLDLAWWPLDALPDGADEVVRGLVRRARTLGLA